MSFIFGHSLSRGRTGVALVLAGLVVAVGASSSSGATLFQRLFNGGKASPPPANSDALVVDPDQFVTLEYCPEVHLQIGGETFSTFDPTHDGDQKYVRYLGSIVRLARECHSPDGLTMSIKVGIAGHLVAGPKGAAGKVTVPLRVTVIRQRDNKALFNKTYSTAVNVVAPAMSADFSEVIDAVTFKRAPEDEDLIVYVGFDQPKKPPATG